MSDSGVVRLGDREFRVAKRIPLAARMRFANAVKTQHDEMGQLDAIYRLCRSALAPDEDYEAFLDEAERIDADDDDLLKFVRAVMVGDTERPTQRSSDSSDGPESTEPKSESVPDSPEESVHARVIRMHEKAGRPDKALLVLMAQEQQMASAS